MKLQVDDVIDLIEAELEGSEEGEPNLIKNVPSQDPKEEIDRVEDDITGNSNDLDEEPDEEDDYPDQYDETGIASEATDADRAKKFEVARNIAKRNRELSRRQLASKQMRAGRKVEMPRKGSPADFEMFKKSMLKGRARSGVDENTIASEMVDRTVLEQDSAYQTYFRGVMKKHGIKGIRGLSKEKRSEFFRDVSAGWRKHKKVKESKELYEQYKKYFQHMLDECSIDDFSTLSETEQAEFYALVNEAFQIFNEQMQKPGAPIENPMNTFDNKIDAMKSQLRPERRAKQRLDAVKASKGMR